ncbi:MHYT domain-containing protein [Hydrogenophilus thermoluteolus]|uniref:MHYT domain-containing protein n=1 Tax=Hydrogenophilus thermoluteolus TaxID=297 RepID=UPI003F67A41B
MNASELFALFFAWPEQGLPLAPVRYQPLLVSLSVTIAVLAGIGALQLLSLARHPERFGARLSHAAFLFAVPMLGFGVWSMHFIGMQAADVCQPVTYAFGPTALSVVPSLFAAWVGLRLLRHRSVTTRDLLVAGVLVGAGIGAMHYTGMAGMITLGEIRYHPVWFLLSIVVAVAFSCLAFFLHFHRGWLRFHRLPRVVVSGTVIGLAISAMHYTAMAGTLFIGQPVADWQPGQGFNWPLALAIVVVLLVVFGFFGGLFAIFGWRATAQRAAQRAALFHQLLDHLPFAIVRFRIHRGQITRIWASRALETLTGLSPARYLAGKGSLLDFLPPQSRSEILARFSAALSREKPEITDTLTLHLPDGSVRRVSVRVLVTPLGSEGDEVDLVLSDLTPIETQAETLAQLVRAIDGLLLRARLSLDGVFLEINARLAETLGYSPEALIGQAHTSLWPDDYPQEARDTFWARLRQGETIEGTFPRKTKEGKIRHLHGWYQPMRRLDGTIDHVLKLAIDITAQIETQHALEQAKQELEVALARERRFFSAISHEIRTPLNAVLGFAELIQQDHPEDTRLQERTSAILAAGRTLLTLLNDLLDLAKLEAGAFTLRPTPTRLDRLLHELTSHYALLARQKGLRFTLSLPNDLPRCWSADGDRLRQILGNLLNNALKFTEQGEIALGAEWDGQTLVLFVRDTGPGIPPAKQQEIFTPFVQVEEVTTRRHGGTGLGLAIVRDLARAMGGDVQVASTPGAGATFTLTLPLTPLPETDCPDEALPHAIGDSAAALLAGKSILAADDVALNRELLAALLTRLGAAVTCVASGNAFFAHYTACPDRWVAGLLDLRMPDGDGITTARAIRHFERAMGLAPLPLIALTGQVAQEERDACHEAGFDAFLAKPLQQRELIAVLQPLVEMRDRLRAHEKTSPDNTIDAPEAAFGLIDPEQGQALWRDAWLTKAQTWLDTVPQAVDAVRDWSAAEWHRIAGTAANLALPRLAHLARTLERHTADGTAREAPLETFVATVRATAHALAALTATQHPDGLHRPERVSQCDPTPLPDADRQALLAMIRRGEITGPALDAIRETHPRLWHNLNTALDAFDFAQAEMLVRTAPTPGDLPDGDPLSHNPATGAPSR